MSGGSYVDLQDGLQAQDLNRTQRLGSVDCELIEGHAKRNLLSSSLAKTRERSDVVTNYQTGFFKNGRDGIKKYSPPFIVTARGIGDVVFLLLPPQLVGAEISGLSSSFGI